MPKQKKMRTVKYESCKTRGKIKTTKHIKSLALYSLFTVDIFEQIAILYYCYSI